MNRVLVTGASGFVGRHLCGMLAASGWRVRGARRRFPPPQDFPVEIEWVETGEYGPHTEWKAALDGITHVVHLAALAHKLDFRNGPSEDDYMRVNVLGTRSLLDGMREAEVLGRFVFLSSIGAVCSSSEEPVHEGSRCAADTPYGKSKLSAEREIVGFLEAGSPDWCIIRAPLVYGFGNPGNMARLLKLMKLPFPLPFGSVRNRRSFIYVGNLVDLIEVVLEHGSASRQIFCASDGEDLSTPELISRLGSQSGRRVWLAPFPTTFLKALARGGDLMQTLSGGSIGLDSYSLERLCGSLSIDCSKVEDVLDWKPPFSVDEGLRDAVRNQPEFRT